MILFEKLRELEKKATPGSWTQNIWGHRDFGAAGVGPRHDHEYAQQAHADGALIAEMRNALPKVFEVLDLFEGELMNFVEYGSINQRDTARQALKRAKEIAGE